MSARKKFILKILSGSSDSNIDFSEMCQLLEYFGFNRRISGSHNIFSKAGIEEIINLQPKGAKCKIYQVKQIRALLIKYKFVSEISDG